MAVLVSAGPAAAQSVSPSPSRVPGVAGQVTGALAAGSRLIIRVDATMPGGWQALHLVEVAIVSGNRELEHLRFDIEDNKLTIGEQRDVIVGTGAVATGTHLRVSGADVVVTTGGANLSFEVDTGVIETIPQDARFELSVVDDLGASAEVTRTLAEPEGSGGGDDPAGRAIRAERRGRLRCVLRGHPKASGTRVRRYHVTISTVAGSGSRSISPTRGTMPSANSPLPTM